MRPDFPNATADGESVVCWRVMDDTHTVRIAMIVSRPALVLSVCVASALVLLPSKPARASDPQDTLECDGSLGELVWAIGTAPERCVAVPPKHQVCSWAAFLRSDESTSVAGKITAALLRFRGYPERYAKALADARHPRGNWLNVVVMAESSGQLAACYVGSQNTEIGIYAETKPRPDRRASQRKRKELRDRVARKRQELSRAALAEFSRVMTLFEVTMWVGEAPERCLAAPEPTLVCTWIAARRSPGFIQVARAAKVEPAPLEISPKVQILCRFPGATAPRTPEACMLASVP